MKKRIKKPNVDINIDNAYLEISGKGWRSPKHVSLKEAMDLMQFDLPPEPNVKLVSFDDQDSSINRPPSTYPVDNDLHLSVDENFLYVWVNSRWKRVPLSNF